MKSFLTLLICLVGTACARAEGTWEFISPTPTWGDISGLSFPSADSGWLVTDQGHLMKTIDGGSSWTTMRLPVRTIGPFAVDFRSGLAGSVVGGAVEDPEYATLLFNTTNGGGVWTIDTLGTQDTSFVATGMCRAGAARWVYGLCYAGIESFPGAFSNIGQGWTFHRVSDQPIVINDGYFINASLGYLVGDFGAIFRTTDGGETWTENDDGIQEVLTAVYFANALNGWIGGGTDGQGVMYRTTNGGGSWVDVLGFPGGGSVKNLVGRPDGGAYAITSNRLDNGGQLLQTTNGTDWSVRARFDTGLWSIAARNHDVWVGGFNAGLYKADNEVGEFTELSTYISRLPFYTIAFSTPDIGWIGGSGLYRSANGGAGWHAVDTLSGWTFSRICPLNSQYIFASTISAPEFLSSDGGETWRDLNLAGASSGVAAGIGGTFIATAGSNIYRSTNSGRSWDFITSAAARVKDMVALPGGRVFGVVTDSPLLMSEDLGEHWGVAELFPFLNCNALSYISDSIGFAAGDGDDGQALYRTTDAGSNWAVVDRLPFIPDELHFLSPAFGFALVHQSVMMTTDSGFTWTTSENYSANHVTALNRNFSGQMWAVGATGMIQRWSDPERGAPIHQNEPGPRLIVLLSAWPNPTNGRLNVNWNGLTHGNRGAFLTDVTGRAVGRLIWQSGSNLIDLNLDGLPTGAYFLTPEQKNARSLKIELIK